MASRPKVEWQPLPSAYRTLAAQSKCCVLLETAMPTREKDRSLLFLNPAFELVAWNGQELEHLLDEVDRYTAAGFYVAGYFAYECGEAFLGLTPSTRGPELAQKPLAWLGVFESVREFRHTGPAASPATEPVPYTEALILSDGMNISRSDYHERIDRVQHYLQAGHSYQVNFTDSITGRILSTPEAVYATLLQAQPVSYAAYIKAPDETILSFSPELFYRTSGNTLTVRPMKGTWPRGADAEEDCEAARALATDEKNRSEHVTIVDLLRNDVGRLCAAGSVRVDSLFAVERYNTLLQMTSTISGTLESNVSPSEVFRNLFPSGSITGAPKRRTMEIIRELEAGPRGVYTGAIGYFAPNSEACFNVAIRTMELDGDAFRLGVGGGITADSDADQEYEECCLKGSFLTRQQPSFALLETMRCVDSAIPLLKLHMDRLASSATYFGFRYDSEALEAQLTALAAPCGPQPSRLRVEVDSHGRTTTTLTPLDAVAWNGRVLLATRRTNSRDIFLRHKTTHRSLYDEELVAARAAGFDEVLFQNEHSEFTECAISNIFFYVDGRWITPELCCGVLPGIQRAIELESMRPVRQTKLSLNDLASVERILVTNSVRGSRNVSELWNADGQVVWRTSGRH